MTVTPIEGEPTRFWVSSESRSDVDHIVDMDWRYEKWSKPTVRCSCEACQAHGIKYCKHVETVIRHEMTRLGI